MQPGNGYSFATSGAVYGSNGRQPQRCDGVGGAGVVPPSIGGWGACSGGPCGAGMYTGALCAGASQAVGMCAGASQAVGMCAGGSQAGGMCAGGSCTGGTCAGGTVPSWQQHQQHEGMIGAQRIGLNLAANAEAARRRVVEEEEAARRQRVEEEEAARRRREEEAEAARCQREAEEAARRSAQEEKERQAAERLEAEQRAMELRAARESERAAQRKAEQDQAKRARQEKARAWLDAERAKLADEPEPFELMAQQLERESAAKRAKERAQAERMEREVAERERKRAAAVAQADKLAVERIAARAAREAEAAAADAAAKAALAAKVERKAARERERERERKAERGRERKAERGREREEAAEGVGAAQKRPRSSLDASVDARMDGHGGGKPEHTAASVAAQRRPGLDGPAGSGATEGASRGAPSAAKRPSAALPEGWSEVMHQAKARNYSTFRGPNGERAKSRAEAWRLHERSEDGHSAATSGGGGAEKRAEAAGSAAAGSAAAGSAPKRPKATPVVGAAPAPAPATATAPAPATDVNDPPAPVAEADSSDEEEEIKARTDPLMGMRVSVWWTGERRWFAGRVQALKRDPAKPRVWAHQVLYEADGVACWHQLVGPDPVKWRKLAPLQQAAAAEATTVAQAGAGRGVDEGQEGV